MFDIEYKPVSPTCIFSNYECKIIVLTLHKLRNSLRGSIQVLYFSRSTNNYKESPALKILLR